MPKKKHKQSGSQTVITNNDNNDNISTSNNSNGNVLVDRTDSLEKCYWNLVARSIFEKNLNNAYEKSVNGRIVCLYYLMMQLGKSISKRSHVSWNYDTKRAIKLNIAKSSSYHTGDFSQKSSKYSTSKHHLQAIERHIKLLDEGNIEELLYEVMTVQQILTFVNESMTNAIISLKFKNLMSKKWYWALKLLTHNIHNGLLPFTKKTLELLVQKHREPRKPSPDISIHKPTRPFIR